MFVCFLIINLVKLHSHILTFTHSAWRLILFSWACLSKLASCPCVEHAHQTSSTPPIWHMHARHVQWHPHNTELAGERIHFPVRYSTDVCFNFFLIERLRYSINHTQAKKKKKRKHRQSEKCTNLNIQWGGRETHTSNNIDRAMLSHLEGKQPDF